MDSESPRFVAGRCDHAAFARSSNRDRLPAQLRIVALFNRRVERVHVDMDALARATRSAREFFRALFGPHLRPLPIVARGGRGSHEPRVTR